MKTRIFKHYASRNFICANLNLLAPRMLYANLKCIPATGSSEEDFLSFLLYKPIQKYVPQRRWPFMTTGTLFSQNGISLSQGCFIPNINAFGPVVHEKKTF